MITDRETYPEGSERWSVKPSDRQVGGTHYQKMKMTPSEFIRLNNISWYEGNVIKYVCRYKDKGGRQDIEKAIHYLELILEELDKNV